MGHWWTPARGTSASPSSSGTTTTGVGIGAGIARRFARSGRAKVVVAERDTSNGRAVAEAVDGLFVQVDVADRGQVKSVVAHALPWLAAGDQCVQPQRRQRAHGHAGVQRCERGAASADPHRRPRVGAAGCDRQRHLPGGQERGLHARPRRQSRRRGLRRRHEPDAPDRGSLPRHRIGRAVPRCSSTAAVTSTAWPGRRIWTSESATRWRGRGAPTGRCGSAGRGAW